MHLQSKKLEKRFLSIFVPVCLFGLVLLGLLAIQPLPVYAALTFTPTSPPTEIPTEVPTDIPTETSVPPTATPVPPTATSVPPTPEVDVQTPVPTATSVPPTHTPRPSSSGGNNNSPPPAPTATLQPTMPPQALPELGHGVAAIPIFSFFLISGSILGFMLLVGILALWLIGNIFKR